MLGNYLCGTVTWPHWTVYKGFIPVVIKMSLKGIIIFNTALSQQPSKAIKTPCLQPILWLLLTFTSECRKVLEYRNDIP